MSVGFALSLDVGFHTFRHTGASLLFAQRRNAVEVQRTARD
jgi:integrase